MIRISRNYFLQDAAMRNMNYFFVYFALLFSLMDFNKIKFLL